MTRSPTKAEKTPKAEKAPETQRTATTPGPDVWSAAILKALSEAESPLTIRQIIDRVGKIVNVAAPGPIKGELDVLRTYDFLSFDDSTRRFSLTAGGKALSTALVNEGRH
jgi:hypothetical protein